MKHSSQVLASACLMLCAISAQAQTSAPTVDDHDHNAPGHVHREAKAPQEESNVDYFWRKSDEAFHAGDYPRAINLHRAVIALAPDEIESYGVAAWLLWSSDQKDEARALIERGLLANPRDWQMWQEAGNHFELQKLTAETLNAFRHAVALMPVEANKPGNEMLRRRLAHAAERAGEGALSVQTWRDLARDFPNDVVNQNNLRRVESKK